MTHKKILFIVTSLHEGGAGKMVLHISNVLSKEYRTVYAVATNCEKQYVDNNSKVIFLEPLNEHKGGLWGFSRTINAIRRIVKKTDADIIVSFVSDVAVCTRIATLFMRGKVVVSAERGDPFTNGLMWRKLTRWAYKNSDWCFFQLDNARDYYGAKVVQKSFVIPNAAFFNGEIGSHKSTNKTIVSAGRFVWEKGYDLLIDAFKIVYDKYPDYTLVLYGEGDYKKQYEAQIEKLGLTGRVLFPGYTKNISSALRNEDIFVLSSRLEGIPNVLIEALLTGIPTVSCDCNPGGPRFLTESGEIGLLVPMDDSKALANGITKLIEDRDLYEELEKRGPEIIRKLEPTLIEQKWLDAFHQIARNSK